MLPRAVRAGLKQVTLFQIPFALSLSKGRSCLGPALEKEGLSFDKLRTNGKGISLSFFDR
jgi:hypothetical protein